MPPFKKDALQDALNRGKSLTSQQVLDELRRQGVTDLDDLVNTRLEEIKALSRPAGGRESTGGDEEERGSILIYKCFVLADWE